MQRPWHDSLYYRVKNYLREGYGTEDIVVFLGREKREIIVNEVQKCRKA